jgi:signal transduction histidine kinase
MNAVDFSLPPAHAAIDAEGRLVRADRRLAELNERAGGAIGLPLAVPQIATIARLAKRLGILVSRGVVTADGDDDLELWVRAEPDGEGVRISASGWKHRTPWHPAEGPRREPEPGYGDADWRWETDAALRVTYLSPEAMTRFGVDAAATLGQPVTRLFALSEDEAGGFPILGALATQVRFDNQRAELRGTGRAVRLVASPRADVAGRFAGFVGATYFLLPGPQFSAPSLKPLAANFGTRLDRALRGPLGRIVANADSINAQHDGPLRDEYADYAADIANAGRHLLGLVDDLADMNAIERDNFTTAPDEIDLADVARRAAGLLQVRANELGVRLDRPALDEKLPATGEFRRALQVLVNLIGNAVRYSPPEGMVWIRAERDGPYAVIIVADQGKGIDPEQHERIFEKFERIDVSEPGGSGLGLYIARRLARAMGGDVVVDSAPGQGARFVFTLPLRQG